MSETIQIFGEQFDNVNGLKAYRPDGTEVKFKINDGQANWITDPIPTDNKMHLWVEISSDDPWTVDVFTGNTRGNIDFGDGTETESITNHSGQWGATHIYNKKGQYNITINPTSNLYIAQRGLIASNSPNYINTQKSILRRVYIPTGTLNNVGQYWVQNDSSLSKIDFAEPVGESMLKVCQYAFNGAIFLREINIPEGITSIDPKAFQNCNVLTKVTLPSTITTISNNAFASAGVLSYHIKAQTPPTLESTNAFYNISSSCIFYVPYSEDHSILEAYKTATNWSTYADKIQEE